MLSHCSQCTHAQQLSAQEDHAIRMDKAHDIRGVTALTRAVSGEKQIYPGNLEILPGIGKPGKFFGKYEIFSGH